MDIYKKYYDIPFYDGYKLTEDNQIIGKKGNPLSLTDSGSGHLFANVFVEKPKVLYLHRAIALVHVKGYFPGAQVDHIDRNPNNNDIKNLRWVTCKQNSENRFFRKRRINKKIREKLRKYKTEILYLKKKYHGKISRVF